MNILLSKNEILLNDMINTNEITIQQLDKYAKEIKDIIIIINEDLEQTDKLLQDIVVQFVNMFISYVKINKLNGDDYKKLSKKYFIDSVNNEYSGFLGNKIIDYMSLICDENNIQKHILFGKNLNQFNPDLIIYLLSYYIDLYAIGINHEYDDDYIYNFFIKNIS